MSEETTTSASNGASERPAVARASEGPDEADKAGVNKEEEYCKLASSRLEMKRTAIEQLRSSIRRDATTVLIALVVLFLALMGLAVWVVSKGSLEAASVGSANGLSDQRTAQQDEPPKVRSVSALPAGSTAVAPSPAVSQAGATASDAGSRGSTPASLGSTLIWPFAVCWVALCAVAATLLIVRHQTLERLLLED